MLHSGIVDVVFLVDLGTRKRLVNDYAVFFQFLPDPPRSPSLPQSKFMYFGFRFIIGHHYLLILAPVSKSLPCSLDAVQGFQTCAFFYFFLCSDGKKHGRFFGRSVFPISGRFSWP